ncbi:hypothetical protein BofuT4_P144740.1 [Botrytis cinerea T4]|uniref:Uncharacterized protein n=1 Tax=Botryotinia fuckeliana (strain T4) TaxID=999810 RepID=G2YYG8_BOTF4|nr:hypothetical protein BofuT4_P144740.1 [Botrytis cinerea T4]
MTALQGPIVYLSLHSNTKAIFNCFFTLPTMNYTLYMYTMICWNFDFESVFNAS